MPIWQVSYAERRGSFCPSLPARQRSHSGEAGGSPDGQKKEKPSAAL